MVANNNIQLKIQTGEGITYGIDRQLDAEFGKDITLKGSVWNQIMNEVKADNATTNPQYIGGNTDIKNSKHFIVKEGIYEISQTTWARIKSIAEQALEIKTKEKENDSTANTETKVTIAVDDKTKVLNLLERAQVSNLDDATLEEVINRYSQIMAQNPDTTDEMMALRLRNFVNGKMNAQRMAKWDKDTYEVMNRFIDSDIQNPDITKALRDTKDSNDTIDLSTPDGTKTSIDKLNSLSLSYMEFQDLDNSKDIDIKEYYQKDLIKYYQSIDNLRLDDAKTKAEETLKNLNIKTPEDLMNYAKEIDITSTSVAEEIILSNSVMQFVKLNINSDDNKLDVTEIMAYHAAVANFDTEDNKLDIADYYEFNEAILSGKEMTVNGEKVEAVDYFLNGYYKAIKNR